MPRIRTLPAALVPTPSFTINDDFSGRTVGQPPNPAIWTPHGDGSYGYGIEKFNSKNDPSLVTVQQDPTDATKKMLRVRASRANSTAPWYGGMVTTEVAFPAFQSAYIEFDAILPSSYTGAFPAFWLINQLEGGNTAEIDIMEVFPGGGNKGRGAYLTIHDWVTAGNPSYGPYDHDLVVPNRTPYLPAEDGLKHRWKFVWTAPTPTTGTMQLFIDDSDQGILSSSTISPWIWSNHSMYLVMNMAVNPSWSGMTIPTSTLTLDAYFGNIKVRKLS